MAAVNIRRNPLVYRESIAPGRRSSKDRSRLEFQSPGRPPPHPRPAPSMAHSAERPILAVTMGDPAGVGPEVVVRAWASEAVHACCRPVVLGRPEILQRAVELVGSDARVTAIDS